MPFPTAAEKHHPGRPCGPCELCGATKHRYTHPQDWEDNTKQLLTTLSGIPLNRCVCKTCTEDIKRNVQNDTYIPRWMRTERVCSVSTCSTKTTKVSSCKLLHVDKIQEVLVDECGCSADQCQSDDVLLCQHHYNVVYRSIPGNQEKMQHKKCSVCLTSMDSMEPRYCTKPELVKQHLRETRDLDLELTEQSIICRSCYRLCSSIINNSPSLDSNLQTIIASILREEESISGTGLDSCVQYSLVHMCRKIGESLLHNEAILLSEAYQELSLTLEQTIKTKITNHTVNPSSLVTKRHYHQYLVSHLQEHLECTTKEQSTGTILLRKGGDVMKSLSRALLLNYKVKCKSTNSSEQSPPLEVPRHITHSSTVLYDVCDRLNDCVHDTIDRILEQETNHPLDLSTVNIQEWIKKSDKCLWETLLLITRTRKERKLSKEEVFQEKLTDVRKLRLFYMLCIICFNTDSRCNIPLHTQLTDIVDSHGGTLELIQILNRLGAISSSDTHARYVDFIVDNTKEDKLKAINFNDLIVASMDNIDFLRSYTAVYCGNQLRSWHGTTIQIVQPIPTGTNDNHKCGARSKRKVSTPALELPPCSKKARRSRTAAERGQHSSDVTLNLPLLDVLPPDPTTVSQSDLIEGATVEQFQVSSCEQESLTKFEKSAFSYIECRTTDSSTPTLQEFLLIRAKSQGCNPRVPSRYKYIEVLDMNADTKEAVLSTLATLHKELKIGENLKHLVVVTDAKIFPYMHEVKKEHKEEFDWVVTYPGDFHILLNYQKVLMKVYWDAGFKQLASASGFKGATLTSLQNCSNFTNTTRFLFQVWEALYQHMYTQFKNSTSGDNEESDPQSASVELCEAFRAFVAEKATKDDNWSFWSEFIFTNGLSFIALYMSVRTSQWNLRLASIKQMVPIFAAFDRPNYHKLLPQHIADMLQAPTTLVQALKDGGFTVSLSGQLFHDVAIDEAHEMLINKDMKRVITRPSKERLQQMAGYYQHRASCLLNLTEQVLPTARDPKYKNYTRDVTNITSMLKEISGKNLLPMTSTTTILRNSFTGQVATGDQRHHLMTFRDVGQEEYNTYVKHTYIKRSSTKMVAKRQRLKTFTKPKVNKQRLQTSDRDKKKLSMCLKRRLEAATTSLPSQFRSEQYLELPRAICNSNGMPNKGTKSTVRDYLENRYQTICSPTLPPNWNTQSVIIDGMFMIHSVPKDGSTMRQYANMLIQRYMNQYIQHGVQQVHVVFDYSIGFSDHPKQIEHSQRYGPQAQCPFNEHINPTDETKANPRDWNIILQCQHCKQRLTNYLGNSFLQLATTYLKNEQKLFVAGCQNGGVFERVLYSTYQSSHIPEPSLRCNAPEADTRIWLHAMHCINETRSNVLIVSADTDTIFIGLTLPLSSDLIYIKINATGRPAKYMSMYKLQECILTDAALSTIPDDKRASTIQTLFVLTGCDFTSFFSGIGKTTFFNTLIKHTKFISGTELLSGSLYECTPDSFLAFVRLVGCAYFDKHQSAFGGVQTPSSLYYSLHRSEISQHEQHCTWLSTIRDAVWQRIYFEDDLLPTAEALLRHYKRAMWVMNYWTQSTNNSMDFPPLEEYGYIRTGDSVTPDWDSTENIQTVKDRVNFLLKGCSCKKSHCKTKQCKCEKSGRLCGPGCRCVGCENKEITKLTDTESDTSDEAIETEIVFDDLD